jgi:hypothetical protein
MSAQADYCIILLQTLESCLLDKIISIIKRYMLSMHIRTSLRGDRCFREVECNFSARVVKEQEQEPIMRTLLSCNFDRYIFLLT